MNQYQKQRKKRQIKRFCTFTAEDPIGHENIDNEEDEKAITFG